MITGWLKPDGTFFECPLYHHYKELIKLPEVQKIKGVAKILKELQRIEESCQEAKDAGEHPEWHRYEIAEDRSVSDIHRKILDAGFIRVGENRGSLHFEGRPNHLKNRYQKCKDLADSYGADCKFDSVR